MYDSGTRNLSEQWQDELYEKFGVHFELVDRHTVEEVQQEIHLLIWIKSYVG